MLPDEIAARIRARGIFVFGVETTNFDPSDGAIKALVIYIPPTEFKPFVVVYYPFMKAAAEEGQRIYSEREVFEPLRSVFEDPNIVGVAQDAKFHTLFLERLDLPKPFQVKLRLACSMIAAYMVYNGTRKSYRLQDLAQGLLGITISKHEEVQQGVFDFARKTSKEYTVERVVTTWKVYEHAMNKMKDQADLRTLYWTLEMPMVRVLMEMERTGVLVDARELYPIKERMEKRMKEIEDTIFAKVGWHPDFMEPRDVSRLIYDKPERGGLGLPLYGAKKNKNNHYPVAKEDLEAIASRHIKFQDAALIVEWRRLNSCLNTYLNHMIQASDASRRVHCRFKQVRHPVGRMTCSEPFSLTDLPKDEGIRRAIKAHYSGDRESEDDLVFLDVDFDQLELRSLAHLADDELLIDTFIRDKCECDDFKKNNRCRHTDPHTLVAESLNITRQRAKAINYGIIYGMGFTLLAKTTGMYTKEGHIDTKKSKSTIKSWFGVFKKTARYFNTIGMAAIKNDWVVTSATGRTIKINVYGMGDRSAGIRKVDHFVVSSFATDLVKKTMVRIFRARNQNAVSDPAWLRMKGVLQVHDQMLYQLPRDLLDRAAHLVKTEVTRAAEYLKVPLTCSLRTGKNYEDLERLDCRHY